MFYKFKAKYSLMDQVDISKTKLDFLDRNDLDLLDCASQSEYSFKKNLTLVLFKIYARKNNLITTSGFLNKISYKSEENISKIMHEEMNELQEALKRIHFDILTKGLSGTAANSLPLDLDIRLKIINKMYKEFNNCKIAFEELKNAFLDNTLEYTGKSFVEIQDKIEKANCKVERINNAFENEIIKIQSRLSPIDFYQGTDPFEDKETTESLGNITPKQ